MSSGSRHPSRRVTRISLGATVSIAMVLVAGCGGGGGYGGGGGGGVTTPPEPTFANVQTRVFNAKCAFVGCHAGANPQEGMNLSAGQAYANIVGVASVENPQFQRVDPGNAADSYLYMKVVADPRITGARMPFGEPPLSTEDRMLIADWIQAGAPNN